MTNEVKIKDELIEELIATVNPAEILTKDGLFTQLKKKLVERVLEGEMEHELGYKKHSRDDKGDYNRRNGSYKKTVLDKNGDQLKIEIPRDRDAQYEPKLIPKGLRRIEGFDDQVVSLYARGMTMSVNRRAIIHQ